jgi:flagella basal body P-ring formation protein FlgA
MRSPVLTCLWAVAVCAGLGLMACAQPPDEGAVVVTLRASASINAATVCVGHVASLSGGTPALRQQISVLDLADRPQRGKPVQLLRELIAYRIQVAGVDRGRFRMQGAALVDVSLAAGPAGEEELFQTARDALLDKLCLRPDEAMVSMAQPPQLPQFAVSAKDELRLEAVPCEPIAVPGRCRVDITVLLNAQRIDIVPVLLDVRIYKMAAVARRRIETGETLTGDNTRIERHAIEAPGGWLTQKDLTAGRKAKRPIAAAEVIAPTAVEPLYADNPILVKQRDLVRLVAQVGSMRVTALAEAQQDGRAGDRIRVRNVDSHKEVVGRVVGRGLVEVDF